MSNPDNSQKFALVISLTLEKGCIHIDTSSSSNNNDDDMTIYKADECRTAPDDRRPLDQADRLEPLARL